MFQATITVMVLIAGSASVPSEIVPAMTMQTSDYIYPTVELCLAASQSRMLGIWDALDDKLKTEGVGIVANAQITCLLKPPPPTEL